jgi:hypothetical protein
MSGYVGEYDNGASATGTSLLVASGTYTVLAHERLVVFTTRSTAGTTETITDGTNTYSQVGGNQTSVTGDTQCWYECKDAIAVTNGTLTQTLGTTSTFRGVHVIRYNGVSNSLASVLVYNTSATFTNAANNVTSGNLTPNFGGGWLLGHVYNTSTGTLDDSAGTGFTQRATFPTESAATGNCTILEDQRITTTTAIAATFTCTTSNQNQSVFGVFLPEDPLQGQICL